MRILVTSAGRRVELVDCLKAANTVVGENVEVITGDLNPSLSPACRVSFRAYGLPPVDHPDYIRTLFSICIQEEVKLVIPTIDPELMVLAAAKPEFAVKGIRINVPDAQCVAICRDKLATAGALAECGIDTPKTAALSDEAWKSWEGPLVLKPTAGSASDGLRRVSCAAEAIAVAPFLKGSYVVQEALPGVEYTVNCYFSDGGQLLCAVPHRRVAVRAGEVSKAVTERNEALLEVAKKLENFPSKFSGVICFQAMVNEGKASVFEVNARFGGGYPLAHIAGARFTDWLALEASGRKAKIEDNWKAGVAMMRFDQALFLDK